MDRRSPCTQYFSILTRTICKSRIKTNTAEIPGYSTICKSHQNQYS
uniref:Uncharacterized protein n=1 Tax=Arundo donax TaxID=35708 RepID=A0A0A8Z965_ARUDO